MTIHEIRSDPQAGALPAAAAEDLYRIGTVATLTGIAVERLRAWERRHGLIPAHRVGKTRFYSRAQLDRLKKLKRLSDNGHPIRSIADLTDEQLDERLAAQRVVPMPDNSTRAGLIGPNLLVLEQQQESIETLNIVARWANMAKFCSDQSAIDHLDVIVVQLPVLLDRHIDTIVRLCPNVSVVAVYQFTTPAEAARLEARGVQTLSWPLTWEALEAAATSSAASVEMAAPGDDRQFSDEDLIAVAVSHADEPSQCPQHLVDLIMRLNAFADYAEEYATLAEPEHFERVSETASAARALLENALATLLGTDSTAT